MRKLLSFGLIILALFFTTFSQPASVNAEENWQIQSFDSVITVQSDGFVHVDETLTVNFDGPKHGIFRDLPFVYTDSSGPTATEVSVSEITIDETAVRYKEERNNANLRVQIGDPDRTITGVHTYGISYTVKGVLKSYSDYDELYWNVTGHEWPVPIHTATATVMLPDPGLVQFACYYGDPGSATTCEGVKQNEQTVHFKVSNLNKTGEGLTVAVGYSKGMVPILTATPPPSPWQAVVAWPSLVAFGATLILGLSFIARKWLQGGRDKWYGHRAIAEGEESVVPLGTKESIAPEFSPPNNLRPAEIGILVDEDADTLDITATIVDLASRGYLTITEEPKTWRFGKSDYVLSQKKTDKKVLRKYEEVLLSALFKDESEVRLSDLKNTFYDDLAKVKTELYKEAVKQGFFVKNPESVRNNYIAGGIFLLILGIVLTIVGLVNTISVSIGLGVGLAIVGFVLLVTSSAMPARTAKGRHLYRQALGYQLFITKAEKYRAQFAEKENLFTEVLPYAIVFGATRKLAKAMEVLGIQPTQPSWYHGSTAFHSTAFARDLDNFSSSLSSAMVSSPSSSGSGGGGSSGGGFGGGGGGSW